MKMKSIGSKGFVNIIDVTNQLSCLAEKATRQTRACRVSMETNHLSKEGKNLQRNKRSEFCKSLFIYTRLLVKHNIPLPSARLVEDNGCMLIQPSLANREYAAMSHDGTRMEGLNHPR
jgi:hypothetical protein